MTRSISFRASALRTASGRAALALVVALLAALPWPRALAQNFTESIAAVVNDQVISKFDLDGRLRLVIVSTGLQDTPETRQRLTAPVLHALIDETLEQQEAKRLNITVSTKEIEDAIGRIAARNNMSKDQFHELLKRNDIPLAALVEQVRASLAWHKVVEQRIQPTIEIGDDQVDDYLKRLKADENKPQYHLEDIFLGVDSPRQADDVKRTADRLAEQIRTGANFAAVARQFSQSATAASGGDLGWVEQGALDPDLEAAVSKLKPGQVSDPIRTVTGYHIVRLLDERVGVTAADPNKAELTIEHFFLPGPPNATPRDLDSLRSVAQSVAETATSCPDFLALKKALPDAKTVLPERLTAADLAPVLRAVALKLPLNKASEPITLNGGIFVMMVCSRSGEGGLPTANQVRERLGLEKLDLLTRRYLRDLRQEAFIDVRV
ncbi:MAG TPA: peptidylprolyl isomerase [Alphaproteobacteria bacterium]|nr:peptidylprolyl isomerase [Alphaproteobacteria bacterium]